MKSKNGIRMFYMVLCAICTFSCMNINALAESYTNLGNDTYFTVQEGKSISGSQIASTGNCWTWAQAMYKKIWGVEFLSDFAGTASSGYNLLRNLGDSDRSLTADHLKMFIGASQLGASIRITACTSTCSGFSHDGCNLHSSPGHNLILVAKDTNGLTVIDDHTHQGTRAVYTFRFTWQGFVNYWAGAGYPYIKYIKWPNAPVYGSGATDPKPASAFRFKDVTYPKTFKINTTNGWSLGSGIIESNYSLTSIRSQILNSSGGAVSDSGVKSISGYSYSIKALDDYSGTNNGVRFSWISSAGSYTWRLTATDSGGRTLVMDMPFTAVSSGSTSTATMSKEYASAVSVTGVKVDLTSVALWENETTTLTTTIIPSNATNQAVTWTSSNSAVATVTPVSGNAKQATIKAVKAGTATITCKTSDGSKTATCAVTVKKHATGLSLSSSNLTLKVGDTSTLTASVLPSDATNKTVHWTSNSTSIATVTNGVVKGVAAGTTTITAMTEDSGYTKECTVTVVVPVSSITLSKTSLSLVKGNTASLTATVNPSNATNKKVNWASSNTAVATVNSSGTVTVVDIGSATITCTAADGFGAKSTCTVKVTTSGKCGKNLTWVSDGNNVTISGTGEMDNYSYESPWGRQISSVVVENGVTSIGTLAFYNCRNLTSVKLPNSLKSIYFGSFEYCTSLNNLSIPNSTETIGNTAFAWSGLTEIKIPASVKTISYGAFSGCDKLTDISIDSANQNYVSTNSVIIGKKDGCLVTYSSANKATEYIVPDNVKSIQNYAFLNAKSLKNITIPANVSSIGSAAFDACNLSEIKCYEDSAAHQYAASKGIPFVIIERPCAHNTVAIDEAVAPTCTEPGKTEGSHCSKCNAVIVPQQEIPASGHKWGGWGIVWNDDYTAFAQRNCTADGCNEKENKEVTVTHGTTTAATCEGTGVETYTATLTIDGNIVDAGNNTTTAEISALGHDWGEATYVWNKETAGAWTATASHACLRDGCATKTETESGTMTAEITIPATYEANGVRKWTATFTKFGFTTQTAEEVIPMLVKGQEVQAVIDAINALSANAGLADKAAVDAARAAYDALTPDQRKLISADVLAKLTTAESQVKAAEEAAKKAQDDAAAAQAVIDAINALSANVGLNDKAAVEAVRAAYDKLTDDQKKLVSAYVLEKLTTAESQVKAAEEAKQVEEEAAKKQAEDAAAAQAVIDAINKLSGNAGVDDKDAVEAARAAYDALTEDQKKLISADVLTRLTTAEEQVQAAEEAAKTVEISACQITVKDLTYTGKKIKKPTVTVKYDDMKLKEGTDYTLSYDKKAKNIGSYKLTVSGMGKYTGSKKVKFNVIPKGTAFTKLTGGKQQITLKWKSQKNITGYQIEYSLKKDFSGSKKVTIKKAKTLTTTIKKLKDGKTYYVRIRTYTTVKKKDYYSTWSKAKTVKTKSTGKKSNESEDQVFEVTMNVGESLDLKAMLENGEAVEDWTTSDAEIAMVSLDGVVTALQPGEAVVTAICADGDEIAFAVSVEIGEIGLVGIGEVGILETEDLIDDEIDGEIEIEIG